MNRTAETGERARVGGQAIIEGVMMRSPERTSAAVRLPGGEIIEKIWSGRAWSRRGKGLGLPIVRGAVSLAEALVLGLRTLNWSADVVLQHEKKKQKKRGIGDKIGLIASMTVAVLLALALFMWLPYQIATMLKADQNQALFHLVAGSTRIAFFLLYLWLISLSKDIRRVFEYHGAEHQAIFTYEKHEPLSPEHAGRQSRFHPRCGTSFILIVALLTMVLFVIFDFAKVTLWGPYSSALTRLLIHLPFLPLVAGISYEFLRLSDRYAKSPLMAWIIKPGLSLQKITTRLPDDSQREVALVALKAALPEEQTEPLLEADYTAKSAAG